MLKLVRMMERHVVVNRIKAGFKFVLVSDVYFSTLGLEDDV